MGYKVLITEKVDDVGPCLLKEQGYELVYGTGPDEETLIRECADCDGALTRNGKFTARVYDACPKLKVVAMHGVGVDGIDVEEATARGIQICNAGESNQNSVAEYAIGLILMLAKRTITYNSGTKGNEMNVVRKIYGNDVNGKILGIIGMGKIGTRVAHGQRPRHEGAGLQPQDLEAGEDGLWMADPGYGGSDLPGGFPFPAPAGKFHHEQDPERRADDADEADGVPHQHRPGRSDR